MADVLKCYCGNTLLAEVSERSVTGEVMEESPDLYCPACNTLLEVNPESGAWTSFKWVGHTWVRQG